MKMIDLRQNCVSTCVLPPMIDSRSEQAHFNSLEIYGTSMCATLENEIHLYQLTRMFDA